MNKEDKIIVRNPKYIKEVATILRQTPSSTIANYLIYNMASQALPYLDERAAGISFEFSKVKYFSFTTFKHGSNFLFLLKYKVSKNNFS